jgi:hypothetical protein
MQPVEKHYDDLLTHVDLVKGGYSKGLFVVGDAGIGKTTQITNVLQGTQFVRIGGHLSALKLYKLLYMYNDGFIIFMDDTETLMNNKQCNVILKQALDTSDPRTVSWDTSTGLLHGFPHSFDFKSKIIFCLNEIPEDDSFKAIIDRADMVYINFNSPTRFDVMYQIAKKEKKIGNYLLTPEDRKMLVDFIKTNMDVMAINDISLRTQYKAENYYVYGMVNGKDWKHLIMTMLNGR